MSLILHLEIFLSSIVCFLDRLLLVDFDIALDLTLLKTCVNSVVNEVIY